MRFMKDFLDELTDKSVRKQLSNALSCSEFSSGRR